MPRSRKKLSIDKSSTFGGTVVIDFEPFPPHCPEVQTVTFRAGGTLRYEYSGGWSMVNGQIRFADGRESWAIFVLCEADRCELWDYAVFYREGSTIKFAFRSDYDNEPPLSLTDRKLFDIEEGDLLPFSDWKQLLESATGQPIASLKPWRYKCDAPLGAKDIHVGLTGWTDESDRERQIAAAEQLPGVIEHWRLLHSALRPPTELVQSSNDVRNKFAYERWQAGDTLKQIWLAINARPDWEHLADIRAVRGPIQSWASKFNPPLPVSKRHRGRPHGPAIS